MNSETKALVVIAIAHVEQHNTPVEVGNILIEWVNGRIKITN